MLWFQGFSQISQITNVIPCDVSCFTSFYEILCRIFQFLRHCKKNAGSYPNHIKRHKMVFMTPLCQPHETLLKIHKSIIVTVFYLEDVEITLFSPQWFCLVVRLMCKHGTNGSSTAKIHSLLNRILRDVVLPGSCYVYLLIFPNVCRSFVFNPHWW